MPFTKRDQLGPPKERKRRRLGQSERGKARREEQRSVREQQIARFPYCEPRRAGAPGECWGGLTRHHVWPLARGGPDCLENALTACSEHNRLLSQDADVMRWGYENEFLVHADDGPAFMAAGGFRR